MRQNAEKSRSPVPSQHPPPNLTKTQTSSVNEHVLISSISRTQDGRDRKRKRETENDDLEARYLQKLHREDLKDETKRQKPNASVKVNPGTDTQPSGGNENSVEESENERDKSDETSSESAAGNDPLPQHETLGKANEENELERASRTVFLGNVSNEAIKSRLAKKVLLDHLSSILVSLPRSDVPHRVESFRFRSTAFSDTSRPRKAAFVKGELMDATTKSTNAYVVYTTKAAAREAAKKLNGTIVLERHLRVDEVAHPAKIDHRRCVFVGNLGFVDDESAINASNVEGNDKRPTKKKPPADIEEGLWRQFSHAGSLESVRVVRDKVTRVGKGIAYVQFKVGSKSVHM